MAPVNAEWASTCGASPTPAGYLFTVSWSSCMPHPTISCEKDGGQRILALWQLNPFPTVRAKLRSSTHTVRSLGNVPCIQGNMRCSHLGNIGKRFYALLEGLYK